MPFSHWMLFPVVLLFLSCESAHQGDEYARMESESTASAEYTKTTADGAGDPGERIDAAIERKVLYTARLQLEVVDLERAEKKLREVLRGFDVEIAEEHAMRYNYRLENLWTLRVLPEEFDSLLLVLEQLGEMRDRQVSAEDVTRTYADLDARLRAKRAAEERYRQIMGQANSVEEVLQVETELRKIIEEIEATEAQFRSLKDRIKRATVNLTLYQELSRPVEGPAPFARRMGRAFSSGWALLQDLFVGLVALWPLWIILLVAGLTWRQYRKRKRA